MTTEGHTPEALTTAEIKAFHFNGSGSEFFRIWIVNILLSIITLGIYSAWAKVRTNRYLYGNTSVAEGYFDYHAEPLIILRGRIIAVVLLLIYSFAAELMPVLGAFMGLALVIALPFVVVRALAFNARVTSWRSIRFNFDGDVGQAFGAYFGWPLLGMLSLGLAMPFAWFKKAEFGVNNHRLGRTPFRLGAQPRHFYVIALVLVLIGIAAVIALGSMSSVLGPLLSALDGDEEEAAAVVKILLPVIFLLYFLVFSLFSALRFRAVYNNLQLGDNRINNSMSIGKYLLIAITNALLMAITLGLYYPWAKVRMTRFLIDSLSLSAVNIDNFVAAAKEEQSAFGEEFGEAFDLGIGV